MSHRTQNSGMQANESPGNCDLTRREGGYSLRALFFMMTLWGRDEGAQERYRAHFAPRWNSIA